MIRDLLRSASLRNEEQTLSPPDESCDEHQHRSSVVEPLKIEGIQSQFLSLFKKHNAHSLKI